MEEKCKTCIHPYPCVECVNCGTVFWHYTPYTAPTNAERIRAKSDEDLAAWLIYSICKYVQCKDNCPVVSGEGPKDKVCKENILLWLQQPATEEDDDEG